MSRTMVVTRKTRGPRYECLVAMMDTAEYEASVEGVWQVNVSAWYTCRDVVGHVAGPDLAITRPEAEGLARQWLEGGGKRRVELSIEGELPAMTFCES